MTGRGALQRHQAKFQAKLAAKDAARAAASASVGLSPKAPSVVKSPVRTPEAQHQQQHTWKAPLLSPAVSPDVSSVIRATRAEAFAARQEAAEAAKKLIDVQQRCEEALNLKVQELQQERELVEATVIRTLRCQSDESRHHTRQRLENEYQQKIDKV